jgi:D-alanine-D-alanine ligase
MSLPLRITVLLGGPSAEREVSLRSGVAVAHALRSLGHAVTEVDPRNGQLSLPARTDVVFLALHGTYGEDGTVQKQLEKLGVPYTGCGPAASELAFDKVATKRRLFELKIPTPRFTVLRSSDVPWPTGWQPPLVLKPVRQGSSVGLQFVDEAEQWQPAVKQSFEYDREILVEERIIGRETTVGILAGEALPVVEVRPKQGAYDYTNKYTSGRTEYLCPAPFEDAVARRIQEVALAAFHAIDGRDYARVDVMVAANAEPHVLEVNTLPGMTETSLLPKAAAAAGLGYAELCQRMVDLALRRERSATAPPNDFEPNTGER